MVSFSSYKNGLVPGLLCLGLWTSTLATGSAAWADEETLDLAPRPTALTSVNYDQEGDLLEEFYQKTSVKFQLYPNYLDGYVDGLPSGLAVAERNIGQVQSEFDQQKPMLWLKMKFDARNSLRSKLGSLFS